MIELVSIRKSYGSIRALDGVSLAVPGGALYGLLGPNGAGKTTALKILAGLLRAEAGAARIDGHEVAVERRAASLATGYVPDRPVLYDKLTAREYLAFVASLYGLPREPMERRAAGLLERFDLADRLDRRIESFSHGMRQKLSLTAALARQPRALLIDEPIVGLDPAGVRRMRAVLQEAAAGGAAVLLSTHSLEVARAVCGRLGILHHGRMIAEGSSDELMGLAARAVDGSAAPSSLEDAFLQLTAEGASQAADLSGGTGAQGQADP